jgi:uncharacterized protein (TIGR02569 family)
MIPPNNVIKNFGIKGKIKKFSGGQGTTYLIRDIVLKPTDDEKELIWIAETFNRLKANQLRLPKYIKSKNNKWIENGWAAYHHIEGKHYKKRINEKKDVSEKFHLLIKRLPCPSFIKYRKNPWSKADKMAWEEIPLKCHTKIKPYALKLKSCLKPIKLKNQIIHGDIGGNILFSNDKPPAVIDFSPYFRPVDFALAILVVDSLVWDDTSNNILKLFKDKKEFTQLLLRAELRRILEISFCLTYLKKVNINEINQHKSTIELLCSLK